jgi:ferredoxin
MANILDRLPQNAPGRFYVDSTCTDCGLCPSTAPAISAATTRSAKASSSASQ